MTVREQLRALAEALPEGAAVTVPRAWILEAIDGSPPAPVSGADQLLTAEAVATRLDCSVRSVYRAAKAWPFTVRLGAKALRFSERGLNRWLASHRRGAA